jgi:hypothetical protein
MTGDERQPSEIGHFTHHHAVTMTGAVDTDTALSAVTGLGFIAGFRARAVSVGADGRCKVVDFERLTVLQEWHIKGPATALSVLSLKVVEHGESVATVDRRRVVSQTSLKASVPEHKGVSEVCYVAIGRIDGRVLIYDTQGNLLRDVVVDGEGGRVLDVEWIRGPKSKALDESKRVEMMKNSSWIDRGDINGENDETQKVIAEIPTEDVFDTVNHQKLEGLIEREIPHVTTQGYMDLFSPVKPVEQLRPERESPKRRSSARPRPRVTSSTYRSPVSTPTQETTSGKSQPTSSRSEREAARSSAISKAYSGVQASDVKIQHRSTCDTNLHVPGALVTPSSILASTASSTGSTSSKILADIKRFADTATFDKDPKPGSFAIFAPYMRSTSNKALPKRINDDRRKGRSSTSTVKDRRRSSMLGDARKSKTDLVNRAQSPTAVEVGDEDIWLSAESEVENGGSTTKTRRGRRTKQQTYNSNRRRRSKSMSGQPQRPSGAPGSSEHAVRDPETMKIRSMDTSASTYHPQSPSSLFPAPLLTPSEVLESNAYSCVAQSLPSALHSPSFVASDSRYPLLYTPSAIPASTLPSTGYTISESQHASVAPSSSTSPSRSTSAPTEGKVSQSTAPITSHNEFENTVIHNTPQRSRFDSAPTVQLPLPPGYAESFHGPVEVQNYLPRKGSLAAGGKKGPESSPQRKDGRKKRNEARTGGVGKIPRSPVERARERREFGKVVSGNADKVLLEVGTGKDWGTMEAGIVRVEHFERSDGQEKTHKCCRRCEELESEVQRLRDEVRSLRRLIKGKGKVKAVIIPSGT